MANLTKHMLNEAGFDARLTWLGTKRIAYNYNEHPSLSVDNHMICTVIHNGKKYFLDPTEKYNTFGEYAERIQGQQVLIEDGDNYILEKIPIMSNKDNRQKKKTKLRLDGEILKGNSNWDYHGESRAYLLYNINYTDSDKLDEALTYHISKDNKNFKLENLKTTDFNDRDKPFGISYDFELKNAATVFGDEIYVDLDYYKEYSKSVFKERKQDYQFSHKLLLEQEVELEIPQGYKAGELPEGMNEKFDDFSFVVDYRLSGNKILYSKKITVDNAVVKTSDFDKWNNAIKKLDENYQNQIVFIKK